MASISNLKNGRRAIQFVGADMKRRSIRLGKMSRRAAETIKVRVEALVAANLSGQPIDGDTARWVAELQDDFAEKLAKVGLIESRKSLAVETLGGYLDTYIASRVDVKPATMYKYKNTRRKLVAFFGEGKPLAEVTPGDADEFRLYLVSKGMVENTVRKNIAIAKVFFNAAVRKRLLPASPFDGIVATIQPNVERFHFVSREVADKVLAACPDAEWRLVFALSRYGGLRCPSEHLALRWGDVNWEHGRLLVRSPKTEHLSGGASRLIPLFPELRPYLEEAFELAEPGTVHVINRYRDATVNLRTQLIRIIRRAGLEPWPKLFQNLRSTRETELAEEFPLHVVTTWIGNSELVAAKHYLQTTDAHFDRALQKAVQSAHAEPCKSPQVEKPETQKPLQLQGFADLCGMVHGRTVLPQGLEP